MRLTLRVFDIFNVGDESAISNKKTKTAPSR
jgi:hypothetical protein